MCVCSRGWHTWAGTPWDQVHPPPRDQVHLPRTRYTSPGPGTPPRTRYTPQNQVHPQDQVTHGTRYTAPGLGTPPQTRYTSQNQVHPPPADGYCCGRYASYWNAFLLIFNIYCPGTEHVTKICKLHVTNVVLTNGLWLSLVSVICNICCCLATLVLTAANKCDLRLQS